MSGQIPAGGTGPLVTLDQLLALLTREPLLVLVAPDGNPVPSLVLAPTGNGRAVVLGIVDNDGDNAVMALDRDAAAALAHVLIMWIAS